MGESAEGKTPETILIAIVKVLSRIGMKKRKSFGMTTFINCLRIK